MRVVITGGTGFIGSKLTDRLLSVGQKVVALGRQVSQASKNPDLKYVQCDTTLPGEWQDEIKQADVVVNLAGASIFQRWTPKVKEIIISSRIKTTENVVSAIGDQKDQAITLLSVDGVGYYGFHDDELIDESVPPGSDFLAQLGIRWESAAKLAEEFGARVVICRFGVVMGKNGGALQQLTRIAKLGMGCQLGDGNQWFTWIHQDDLADILEYLIGNNSISGPVNVAAPNPVRNKELMQSIRRALKVPLLLPRVPGFMIRPIAGEFADVLLKGQRVIPMVLQENNYKFKYPSIEKALESILSKK
ncbi:MAG: TIGR01777 family oxidoreductase [Dehalococcoidia bacterium]|nr:MAG: TIGR01777 family oxidoreductase [Dehalococcoidia bacterium]